MTSTISTYVGLYMTTYAETALHLHTPTAITAPLIGGTTTIVFALLGGWLAGLIFNIGYNEFWSIQSWLIAIVGAIIVLLIWGLITRGSRKSAA